jgi:hypothetical protein
MAMCEFSGELLDVSGQMATCIAGSMYTYINAAACNEIQLRPPHVKKIWVPGYTELHDKVVQQGIFNHLIHSRPINIGGLKYRILNTGNSSYASTIHFLYIIIIIMGYMEQ